VGPGDAGDVEDAEDAEDAAVGLGAVVVNPEGTHRPAGPPAELALAIVGTEAEIEWGMEGIVALKRDEHFSTKPKIQVELW
jgi:hypothetical protein